MVLNTIREADLKGKKVLIRVDFNVPLKDGVVTDDTRIKAALPTIKYILENGASLVVMTHLGRPKGEKNEKYSLAPVAAQFEKLLGSKVTLAPDVIGPEVEKEVKALKPGISTATTRSARPTAHMHLQRVSRTTFLPMPASSSRRR